MGGYRAAIDFGTSYTVAAAAGDGLVPEVVQLVDEGRLSSAVALDDAGVLRAGAPVEQVAALTPDRVERAPKRCLDQPGVMLGRRPVETVDLVATVLEYVGKKLRRQFNGTDPGEVWLTHPARWEPGDPRMTRLEAASAQAGLGQARLLAEPCAAALALARRGQLDGIGEGDLVAVYDLGGGTFDTALLSRTADGGFELLGEPGGDPGLGGEWLDDRLYERLAGQLPADDEDGLRDPDSSPDPLRWRQAGFAFRQQIRRAKERLAEETVIQIPLNPPFTLDRLSLSRAELERTATPLITQSADRFELFLQRNSRVPADLAVICLVGGSSRLTVVNRILGHRFNRPIATHGDPKSITALGALSMTASQTTAQPTPRSAQSAAPQAKTTAAPVPSAAETFRLGNLLEQQNDVAEAEAEAEAADQQAIDSGNEGWVQAAIHGLRILGEAAETCSVTGTQLRTLTGHTRPVLAVAWSPDGRQLATASADKTARIWDPANGTQLRTLTGHAGFGCGRKAMAWSPDGRQFATASMASTARIWDPATGAHLRTLTGHGLSVHAVAWSPDGRQFATASHDETARIWDPATGAHLRTLTGHTEYVEAVAWSPDGRYLATASYDRTARIWDPATGKHLHTLSGHTSPVHAVAWSPDGRYLATASYDRTARIWDPATGARLHTLSGHTRPVVAVAWSPDGRYLATASADKTVRIWVIEQIPAPTPRAAAVPTAPRAAAVPTAPSAAAVPTAPSAAAVPTAPDAHGVRSAGAALGEVAQTGSGPARNDPDRADSLTEAERIANSITIELWKSRALGGVASALAPTDPDRAERIANSIRDELQKARALSGVATALAATDPDRAERIAKSITRDYWKAEALSGVARALAATDPDRAARLLTFAERIANSITNERDKSFALKHVATALAATDPDRAERITNSIGDEFQKARALGGVATALAATDPDRAERIANSITYEFEKAPALSDVASALAATDPDRAERITNSIGDEFQKARALGGVATALAATDPDRAARLLTDAERIANSITGQYNKALALGDVAKAVAATSS